MKLVRMKLCLFLAFAIVASFAGAQVPKYSCPAYQTYNGAGACVFTSYTDTPGYLSAQNSEIAASLNASPTGTAAAFARQYGSLPMNQQNAIINCQVSIFNATYFNQPVPSSCPVTRGPNGAQLDLQTLLQTNPAPGNPGNLPSVSWDGAKFVPVVPPQPGTPVLVSQPNVVSAPANGRLVGICYGPTQCAIAPGVNISQLKDGQTTVQDGRAYVAHIQMELMGLGGYWSPQ